MTDFRFLAVQFLRAKTLTEICNLTNRSYKGFSSDEREALLAIARAITREIISKRQEAHRKGLHDETGKTNA
jgi:hypothetical protein